MVEDNRRRISDDLLEEIEENYDGKDFSEKLLNWKNDFSSLDREDVREVVESVFADMNRR